MPFIDEARSELFYTPDHPTQKQMVIFFFYNFSRKTEMLSCDYRHITQAKIIFDLAKIHTRN